MILMIFASDQFNPLKRSTPSFVTPSARNVTFAKPFPADMWSKSFDPCFLGQYKWGALMRAVE